MSDDYQQQVRGIFLQEGAELLEALDTTLLEMEESPEVFDSLQSFMRSTHTFKGIAATAGLPAISNLTHVMEDVADLLRRNQVTASPPLFDQLSRAVDTLRSALGVIAAGSAEPPDIHETENSLRAWAHACAGQDMPSRTAERPILDLVLSTQQRAAVRDARDRGLLILRVEYAASAMVDNPLELIYGLYGRILQLGELLAMNPTEEELSTVLDAGGFTALLATFATADEVRCELFQDDGPQPIVTPFQDLSPPRADALASANPSNQRTMRVEVDVLDDLLRSVGELVINRARLQRIGKGFADVLDDAPLGSDVERAAARLQQIASELQSAVMRARLVPIDRLLRRLKRRVRDARRAHKRNTILRTQGQCTLLDQRALQELTQPLGDLLEQLVMSCAPEQSGIQTTIDVSSRRSGNHVVIEIDTDGVPIASTELDRLRLTLQCNRGDLCACEGPMGPRYVLDFPVTQVIIPGLVVEVSDETFAVPIDDVVEVLKITSGQVQTLSGTRTLSLRGHPVSLLYLREALEVPGSPSTDEAAVLVVRNDERYVGVVVDRVLGKRDLVSKPIGRRVGTVDALSGATLLGDGRIALLVDILPLIREATRAGSADPVDVSAASSSGSPSMTPKARSQA